MLASLRAPPVPRPDLLLAACAPLVWWGAFAPSALWLLPVLSALLVWGGRGPRQAEAGRFVFALLGLLVAARSGLAWYPALGLFARLAVGGALVGWGVGLVALARPRRGAWGVGLLGALWLTAPSAVGLFALLTCALLAGEIRHRLVQDRPLVTPRGLLPLALGFAALSLVAAGIGLLRFAFSYRDPGGRASPFLGFDFGWSDAAGSAPAWVRVVEFASYGLLGLCVLGGLAALAWSLWGFARTALEDWDLHWLKVKPEPVGERVFEGPSLDGVRFLYDGFLRLAAHKGFTRKDFETPREFEARVLTRLPQWRDDVAVLSRAYHPVRYGELPDAPLFDEARKALERLRAGA